MDGVDNWRDGDSVGRQLYAGLTSPAGQTISSEQFHEIKTSFFVAHQLYISLPYYYICVSKQKCSNKTLPNKTLPNQINSPKANQTGPNRI